MFMKEVECHSPDGITFDSINQIIISNNKENNRIEIFNKEMKHLNLHNSEDDIQLNHPRGLCMQPATNNVIVSDTKNNRIQICFINDNYKIHKLYAIEGSEMYHTERKFDYPLGITCNNRGHIIVTDYGNNRIKILDEKGLIRQVMGSIKNQFHYPYDVCVDYNNHNQIIVADYWLRKISIWSSDGSQFIREIPLVDDPYCLTIDHFGQLIIGFKNNISIFDTKNFKILQSFGSIGAKNSKFKIVSKICVNDKNDLLVCDNQNNRIKMFKI